MLFCSYRAGDIEISTVFGCFHLHNGVWLFLELTKSMFEVTRICGKFSIRMPKFRFHDEKSRLELPSWISAINKMSLD